MVQKIVGVCVAVALLLGVGLSDAQEKKQKGTLIGELKSQKPTPNKKNVFIEVLAAGEEKARTYRVQYDKKANGPIPAVLDAVKAAKVGDRVQMEWVNTGEGLAITSFEVLKKKDKE